MPLVLADRVRDTTTTTGTGTVTLSGTAPTGYQSFAVIGNGNTTYYTINAGSQWEVGIGTYSSTGPTLARNTVLESSNSNALVDFAAGTKDVFVTYPADKSVNYDENNNVGIGTTTSSAKLNVNSSSGAPSILLTNSANSNPFLQFANGSFIQGIGSGGEENLRFRAGGTTGALLFDTNSSERMRITATGDVGIGTSFPDAKLTVSGAISASLGAVGTPSYTFTGDLNTGMWSPAADTVAVSTAGTERMRITSAGLVQINTTSGGAQLNVNSSSGAPSILLTNSATSNPYLQFANGNYIMGISDGTMRLYTAGAHAMTFGTDNTDRMRIDSAGNVGIGTSFPAQRLDVLSSGDTPAVFRSAGANTYLQFVNSVASAGYIGYSSSALTFWTSSERMRITATGDVGIGTSSPATRLTVSDGAITAGASGDVLIGRNSSAFPNPGAGYFRLRTNNTDGSNGGISIDTLAANTLTERMCITSAGNVGIGTSTPAAKLDVQGTNGTSGIIVRDSATTNIFDVVPIASNGALVRVFDNAGVSRVQFTAYGASYFNAGNVGIGTTSPDAKLDVLGASSDQLRLRTAETEEYRIGRNASTGLLDFYGSQSGFTGYTFGGIDGERMRIDSAGNVGIGTSSVSAVFGTTVKVYSAGSGGTLEVGGATVNARFYGSEGLGLGGIGTSTNHPFTFISNDTERMRITSAGNVGIACTPLSVTRFQTSIGTDRRFSVFLNGSDNVFGFLTDAGNWTDTFLNGTPLRFGISGTERMRITAAGNVGIGTSSPTRLLSVAGTANAYMDFSASSFRRYTIGSESRGFILYDDTGSAYRMVVDASGNVGIGTTSPSTLLTVAGAVTVNNGVLDLTSGFSLRWATGASAIVGSSGNGDMVFTVGSAERFRVNGASGNVGFGTSSPAGRVHAFNSYSNSSDATFVAEGNIPGLNIRATGGGRFSILTNYGAANTTSIVLGTGTSNPTTEAIRFDHSTGNVGIGSTSPGSRLTVTGTVSFSGALTSGDLADAVGYKGLPPNVQGSGYTLVMADQGKMVTITGGVTIPANGSVAFPVGTSVVIYNNSASSQTISITTDTLRLAGTATTGARTLAQRGFATCIKVAATEWVVTGNVT